MRGPEKDDEWQESLHPQGCCHTDLVHHVVALALPAVVAVDLAIPAQIFGHPDERGRYAFATCSPAPGLVPSTTGFAVHVEATTHWRDAAELAERHPLVDVDPDVLYVDEGAVMTSAGIAAGIDLCRHLVRIDHGAEHASRVARRMVVAPHRDGGQAQYLQRPVPAPGAGLTVTCTWLLERLADPVTVAAMAAHAGWAPRTFARRFVAETGTTPLRWLAAQRLLEARRLLETTELPVDQVAQRCGLGTAANLRLHLARDTGVSPTAYRRTYRGDPTRSVPGIKRRTPVTVGNESSSHQP